MFIVVYRPHNALQCETQYIGPFATDDDAYDHLCSMPALGIHMGPSEDGVIDEPGVKFTQQLTPARQG